MTHNTAAVTAAATCTAVAFTCGTLRRAPSMLRLLPAHQHGYRCVMLARPPPRLGSVIDDRGGRVPPLLGAVASKPEMPLPMRRFFRGVHRIVEEASP